MLFNLSSLNSSSIHRNLDDNTVKNIDPFWHMCIMVIGHTFLLTAGFTSNIVLIMSILFNQELHTSLNFIILNLAFSDLFLSVTSSISHIFLQVQKNMFINLGLCKFYVFTIVICCLLSIFNFALIAVNRYIRLCKSSAVYNVLFSKKLLAIIYFAIWTFSIIFSCLPFFGMGEYGYNTVVHDCFYMNNITSLISILTGIILGGIPSFSVSLFSYYHVFRSIYGAMDNLKKIEQGKESNAMNRRKQENIQSTITVAIAFGVYCLVYITAYVISPLSFFINLHYIVMDMIQLSICLHSSFNPLLLGIRNKKFRISYLRVIKCRLNVLKNK